MDNKIKESKSNKINNIDTLCMKLDEGFVGNVFIDLEKNDSDEVKKLWELKNKTLIFQASILDNEQHLYYRFLEWFEDIVGDSISNFEENRNKKIEEINNLNIKTKERKLLLKKLNDEISHYRYDIENEFNNLQSLILDKVFKKYFNKSQNAWSEQEVPVYNNNFLASRSVIIHSMCKVINSLSGHNAVTNIVLFDMCKIRHDKFIEILNMIISMSEYKVFNLIIVDRKSYIDATVKKALNDKLDFESLIHNSCEVML